MKQPAPGMILILGLLFTWGASFSFAGDRYERLLDPSLKLLYRAQTGENRLSQSEAQKVLARLHAPGQMERWVEPSLLNLVVKFPGDEKRLAEVGFIVDACIGAICTGTLPIEQLPELVRISGIHRIETSRQMWATLNPAGMEGGAGAPSTSAGSEYPKNAGGTGVLIGYIDTGVDIFHSDFIDPSGNTRIKYLLDFSNPGDTNGDGVLDGPGPYGGTLYTEADINAALSAGTFAQGDTTGHGTHGLSVAAGDDTTYPGLAPETDLIVVKASREDGSLGFYSADIINALAFVDEKAGLLGQPYVVNLSLGTMFCSHDGRSLEEQAVDALVGPGISGKVAVIAAGNSSANRSTEYKHFSGTAYVGLDQTHTLIVPAYTPNSGTGNDRILLDLWYEGRDELTITVDGPTSCGSPQVVTEFGTFSDTPTACGDVFIANMGGANPLNGDIEAIILIDDWSSAEPAEGEWTITITGEAIDDNGVYHGWLVDGSIIGNQTPYLSANADNNYLVGKPGGAYNGITVGSYALHDPGTRFLTEWDDVYGQHRIDSTAINGDISNFSSPGPTRDGRVKPELTAPGERVMGAVSRDALPGVSTSIFNYHPWYVAHPNALLTDDTANSRFGMLQGTSFAAPVITGLVARILNEDPALDAIQVRNILINSAMTDGFTGDVPSSEWGYGKADMTMGISSPLPNDVRITTDELPDGFVNEQYSVVLTSSGGTLPYSWTLASGNLPDGLMLDSSGYLGGKPTATGLCSFSIRVQDSSGTPQVTTREYEIVVAANPPLHITKIAHPVARINELYESQLEAQSGVPPYSWSIEGGQLPAGLDMNASGFITGSPTLLGQRNFTALVIDSDSSSVMRSMKIKVLNPSGDNWEALGKMVPQVGAIAVDGNDSSHVACATQGVEMIFETFNGGNSWQPISVNTAMNHRVQQLEINPLTSTLFARALGALWIPSARRLFRYNRTAGDWLEVNPLFNWVILDIEHDASGVSYAFTGDEYEVLHLFRSSDEGDSWTQLGSTLVSMHEKLGSLSIAQSDPLFQYAGTYPAPGGEQTPQLIFNSDDGGLSWNTIPQCEGWADFECSTSDHFDVVMVGPGVNCRTIDGGRTWTTYTHPAGSDTTTYLARSPAEPARLFLGGESGLFRSVDHGASWVESGASENIKAIALDPNDKDNIWISDNSGLLHSVDSGATWTQHNTGLLPIVLHAIAVNPSEPTHVVLVSDDGLFASNSSGATWTLSSHGLGSATLANPVPSAADANLVYLTHDGRLYHSNNRCVTWSETSPAFNPTAMFVAMDADPFDSQTLLASLDGATGTYRSTDQGGTWVTAYAGLPFTEPTDLSFARDIAGKIYLAFGGDDGVWLSWNLGGTWQEFGLNSQPVDMVEPAPSNSDYVYAYSLDEIYFHDPAEPDWLAATVGPTNLVLTLGVDANNPLIAFAGCDHPGTAGNTGGIYKTTDGGRNWALLSGMFDNFDVVSIATHPTESGILYAATNISGVYRSNDGGITWELLSNYGTIADLTNVNLQDPSNEFLLFAGTEGYGVQASTDNGKTFEPRVEGLTNYFINALVFDPDDPTTLYAGSDAGVFKTVDSANTWTLTDLTAGEIADMICDNEGLARRIWVTVAGEGVAFSENGGTTFTLYSTGLASLGLTSIELERLDGAARRIWVTTHGGDGVAFSDDLGQTWTSAAGNGLTDRDLNDLAIGGLARRIWVTGDSGVFFSDDVGLSWSELSLGLPGGVPATSISIDPNTSEVLISLYSDEGGGVYRGGNITGIWQDFSNGLKELKVKKLTNDGGHSVSKALSGTRFFAATRGDGVYTTEIQSETGIPPTITTTSVPDAYSSVPYLTKLRATGGTAPYSWAVVAGSLPPGLALDASNGTINGSPGYVGLYTFTVRVADSRLSADEASLRIQVHEGGGMIFLDSFETGDTNAWSAAVQ